MAFVKQHIPCPACGGSDPAGLNEDGSIYCFSCRVRTPPEKYTAIKKSDEFYGGSEGEYNSLTDRGISLETAKKYGVRSIKNSIGSIVQHSYPYYDSAGKYTGDKVRKSNKAFTWRGTPTNAGLFGQQLCKEGGKYLTIVEGECDAMAAFELTGSQWPVVSLKNGAAGAEKDIKQNLEFVDSFDCVILNFDNDESGYKAAERVANLLRPGKARIVKLPEEYKDANDMLRANQHSAYVKAFWGAKLYTPAGVLNMSEQKEAYKKRKNKVSVPYPWSGINSKLEGLRQGELLLLTGGTGLGKSSVTREIEHWLITQTKDNIGIIALEEDWQRTADGLISISANARLHIDSVRKEISEELIDLFYSELFEDNGERVWIHSHHGMNDIDSIFNKLRYMIIGCDCRWIVLDHLHMLVLSALESDERKAIDSIMHRLRTLVEETGCGLILVCHLRRLEGNRGHENGLETSISHIRGSQAIAQLSDAIISLERNQQSDDPIEASTTKVRVLKSRYTGDVGLASHLYYDQDTGRLKEIEEGAASELEDEL